MPAKEIKELRLSGKLDEAYTMAKAELEADLSNIWGKRNLSWVLYSQLDEYATNLESFLVKINEVKELNLPESEEMFFENISIVIARATRVITHETTIDLHKMHLLFDAIKELPIKRDSKWYSVLFSALHKGMKESHRYIEFADWWDFKNFRPEDFQKEKMPNGRDVMAIAEQGYIAYAKHLLPTQTQQGEVIFDKESAEAFLPILSQIIEKYPQFQYPAYFNAKLLLALGDKDNLLDSILPFVKKKRNDFWAWETLAAALPNEPEKEFACYCKALSCNSPKEMLVSLRQKTAKILISKNLFNEAKTEIELLVQARNDQGWKIPAEVIAWQNQTWYKSAISTSSNSKYYSSHLPVAEALLYHDINETTVFVDFVNRDRKILNFIASETSLGYFKYERFLSDVRIGDVLKVRFQEGSKEGLHQIFTATKVNDETFKNQFMKELQGVVRIPAGKPFGFMEDVFIHPSLVIKYKLTDGMQFTGNAVKSYNQEKKQWGWKLL